MFKLQPNPTFKAPVVIPGPEGAAGTIEIEFRHKGRKALRALFEALGTDKARPDAEVLAEIIVGWSGCDAEFSRDALESLIDSYPAASMAIFFAYRQALFEGREKN